LGARGWTYMFPLVNLLIMLLVIAASVYGFVLLVRFLRLGIEAFTLYIESNKGNKLQ